MVLQIRSCALGQNIEKPLPTSSHRARSAGYPGLSHRPPYHPSPSPVQPGGPEVAPDSMTPGGFSCDYQASGNFRGIQNY